MDDTVNHLELNSKVLMRKLDVRIIPILMIVYCFNYLDRVNIGHARLYGLESSLELSSNQYAWCLSIFFFGYVLFEVPSNMVMMRVAPNRWLSCLMVTWGIISISMAFTTNFTGLMITRLFLGIVEAGFFPGIVFFISFWYSRQEQGIRLACVSASSQIAGFLGGLISYSIHFIAGKGNLEGWQWLFLVEGIPTVILGGLLWIILPPKPRDTKWLTQLEKAFITEKLSKSFVQVDDTQIDKQGLVEVFTDIKIYLYALIYFGINLPMYSMSLLLPSIIRDMGFTNLQAMLLSSPPSALAFFSALSMAYHADKYLNRSLHLLFSLCVTLIGFIIFISVTSIYIKYASFFLILPGSVSNFPSILAWANNNFVGSSKAATCSAFMIAIGNLSGVVGGQLFRPEEAPRFMVSNIVNIVTLVLVLMSTLLLRYLVQLENDKLDKQKITSDQQVTEFRYVL